jgi:hypothetical protein
MIPSSTIDFDVVEAKQNGRSAVSGKSFVLIHLSCQIELEGGGGRLVHIIVPIRLLIILGPFCCKLFWYLDIPPPPYQLIVSLAIGSAFALSDSMNNCLIMIKLSSVLLMTTWRSYI